MRTVVKKHGLPTSWKNVHWGFPLLEEDVKPSHASRLRVKVLVFASKRKLRSFWRKALLNDLGPDCEAAVNGLGCDVENPSKGTKWKEVDPLYACVMGFTLDRLGASVITHESVHAGFAYARRLGTRGYADEGNPYEESVCYPAGYIAGVICNLFHDRGIFEMADKKRKKRTK